MERRIADSLSFTITDTTVFREEVEFHHLDGDTVIIEEYDEKTETWTGSTRELRLTINRDADRGDDNG